MAKKTKEEFIEMGKPHRFTSDNQPSNEAKQKGQNKRKLFKRLADEVVKGEGLKRAKGIAKRLGFNFTDEEFSIEIVMTLRMIERAVLKGDPVAYEKVMNRLRGKVEQGHSIKGQFQLGSKNTILNIGIVDEEGNVEYI